MNPAADTLPKLLRENARQGRTRRAALREKEFGIWRPVSWEGYLGHVGDFCLGLVSMGLARGDTVSILGGNRPGWLYAELAAQAAGAIGVGIYPDSLSKEVSHIVALAGSRFVVAEDQEQVDKLLECGKALPGIVRIVVLDPRGLEGYADPRLVPFEEVEALGRRHGERHPGLFDRMVEATGTEDPAQICTTSGTSGEPKLAVLSHRNLLRMAQNLGKVEARTGEDEIVSFLPLPWIGEQMMSVSSALLFGATVNFPEEPETARENIREIGPHLIFSPPRVWEGLAATVQAKMADASPLKRYLYRRCLPVGHGWADLKLRKERPTWREKARYALAWVLVFRALKDRLGLSRVRSAYTGGAALGPDTLRFFHALGVNLKQIYGQTEISGISCLHGDGDIAFDTVGRPIPETEIRIENPDPQGVGEVVSRSPAVFMGYFRDPEATARTLADGWLRSGDAGYFRPDGHLVIIDRMKDIMTLRGGERFSPQFIENKLKFSPYIREAVCLGHGRDFAAALVCIDYEIVGKWAEDRRLTYTHYADLASKPEVVRLIREEIAGVNRGLPPPQQVRKFVLLYKELDADDEELTRTRKVRRGHVAEKYAPIIEELYGGRDRIDVDAVVRYQDGRTAPLKATLQVTRV